MGAVFIEIVPISVGACCKYEMWFYHVIKFFYLKIDTCSVLNIEHNIDIAVDRT